MANATETVREVITELSNVLLALNARQSAAEATARILDRSADELREVADELRSS